MAALKTDHPDFYAKALEAVRKADKDYDCFITVGKEKPEHKLPLHGLPISIKDNICTRGLLTTAGSKILNNYVPPFDATTVKRIRDAGGWIVGKTAMDEFGFGTFGRNCAYKNPKNPLDTDRVCGGSSSGAGCATAALEIPHAALAESTGGSISAPAAFCGVVGITPTYGLVSRYGLVDYANSLDKIGTMGKTVHDASLLLSIIAGHDERDQTTIRKAPEDYHKYLGKSVKGMTLGIPKEYFAEGDVYDKARDAINILEKEGCKVVDVSLPHTKYAIAAYYIIATSEASTNLSKFCGMRYGLSLPLEGEFNEYFSSVRAKGFGEEAKRRIILGTFARMSGYRSQYYLKALQVRTLIIQDFEKAFRKCDALVSPTMPMVAPRTTELGSITPLQEYLSDVLTVPPNLAGIPMVSVPCGEIKGMPVGLHILGDHLQEGKILSIAHAYEQARK